MGKAFGGVQADSKGRSTKRAWGETRGGRSRRGFYTRQRTTGLGGRRTAGNRAWRKDAGQQNAFGFLEDAVTEGQAFGMAFQRVAKQQARDEDHSL